MCWRQVIFENDIDALNEKERIKEILHGHRYAFVDREYGEQHRIRIRGIQEGADIRRFLNEVRGSYILAEETHKSFFQNFEQFVLYCEMHHELDLYWFPYYFADPPQLELVINHAKLIADKLTVTLDEGYNSHLSHFLGFFYSLTEKQKEEILFSFRERYKKTDISSLQDEMMSTDVYLDQISKMVEAKKLDFFSPYTLESLREKKQYASKTHERTIENAEKSNFLFSKYYICNRWYLNALYVSMILMNIPVIDKFFMNYVLAKERYLLDEMCERNLQTGEEVIWLRESTL